MPQNPTQEIIEIVSTIIEKGPKNTKSSSPKINSKI
jgi:hypothetical protein